MDLGCCDGYGASFVEVGPECVDFGIGVETCNRGVGGRKERAVYHFRAGGNG